MVIGIIAILVGILLPALGKARRAAQGAACLSNLRQLSAAVMMYTSENNFWMPCGAGTGQSVWINGAPSSTGGGLNPPVSGTSDPTVTANWIAWVRTTDPITGISSNNPASPLDQNITYSGLARYLSIPFTLSSYNGAGGLPISNDVSAAYDHVFICPGDDLTSRPNQSSAPYFRYSYSMNDFVSNPPKNQNSGGAGTYGNFLRNGWTYTGKISSIKNSSDIILFICEDSATLDDAAAKFDPYMWSAIAPNNRVNTVSPRHTSDAKSSNVLISGVNQDGYGNASFCDGHAALISRKDCLRQMHTGNPEPDPKGF